MSTPVTASAPVPLRPVAELFERNLSIRHVYHEPIRHGDVTVVPIAKVVFGFGAGMGRVARQRRRGQPGMEGEMGSAAQAGAEGRAEPDGVGGGGGARLTPVGALEIGPRGTRFIHYHRLPQMLGILALGLGAGLLLARQQE